MEMNFVIFIQRMEWTPYFINDCNEMEWTNTIHMSGSYLERLLEWNGTLRNCDMFIGKCIKLVWDWVISIPSNELKERKMMFGGKW